MPGKRLSMRKIKEVLRLKFELGRSNREIGLSCGIGSSTVSEYLQRTRSAGLSWPIPEEMSETALEQLLFPPPPPQGIVRLTPDYAAIHRELQARKHVTLNLLWQEYKEQQPDGYQYSWFCQHYREWAGRLDVVMRHEHRAGEKMFVDYAGQTVNIIDRETGEIKPAQIFVAVLGASNYTFAEATSSQQLEDWVMSHARAFSYFGGVAEVVVPDNLKSGVSKSCRYEPELNPTYQDLARHYRTAVLPTRARKPRDKAKVEAGVLLVERWILARLRHHSFFSLAELNREIRHLLQVLNNKPFKKLPGSRQSLFEEMEKPALKPLPATPYEFAHWKKATVHLDYHVEVEGHYYSVPYTLVRKQLEIRYTAGTVECFHRGQRIASHIRNNDRGRHSTIREHMPANHRQFAEWSPERFKRWAVKIGPQTALLTEALLVQRTYPQQAYRTLLGILRLAKIYSEARLESACERALRFNTLSYRSIESILKNGLDRRPLTATTDNCKPVQHSNIRGAEYYTSPIH
jgi:transposase